MNGRHDVLNLYAGVGGNRRLWDANVTAVESNPKIAGAYKEQFPEDKVIVGDAHQYLQDNYDQFSFIWSSPPCQSHTRLCRTKRKPEFPNMQLYEEILFLQTYAIGRWVVENVVPYYSPPIQPTAQIGRHLFWANFQILNVQDVPRPKNFIASRGQATAEDLKQWLGIRYDGNLYLGNNHCPAQILRNCVHPEIGRQIFDCAHGWPKNE